LEVEEEPAAEVALETTEEALEVAEETMELAEDNAEESEVDTLTEVAVLALVEEVPLPAAEVLQVVVVPAATVAVPEKD